MDERQTTDESNATKLQYCLERHGSQIYTTLLVVKLRKEVSRIYSKSKQPQRI